MMTLRHTPEPSAAGKTHASRVMPIVRSRPAASATVTQLLVPLNDSVLPNLPGLAHVAFATVPVRLFPDPSFALIPLPSSNE